MVDDAVFRLIGVNWQKNGGVVQTRLSLKPAGVVVPYREILVNAIRKEVVEQEKSASRVIDRGDTMAAYAGSGSLDQPTRESANRPHT